MCTPAWPRHIPEMTQHLHRETRASRAYLARTVPAARRAPDRQHVTDRLQQLASAFPRLGLASSSDVPEQAKQVFCVAQAWSGLQCRNGLGQRHADLPQWQTLFLTVNTHPSHPRAKPVHVSGQIPFWRRYYFCYCVNMNMGKSRKGRAT